jgi:putative ABC transport system permease protein
VKYAHLIWRSLWRKKTRTTLTILSILVAFLLFGILSAFRSAFEVGDKLSEAHRLITISKVSMIQPLPLGYLPRIRQIHGVAAVTHSSWFGGYYQDPRNQFGQFPIDTDSYLAMYPEIILSPEQRDAFAKNRTGALIGRDISRNFKLKIGDRVPLVGPIYAKTDGSRNWDFTVEGVFENSNRSSGTGFMLFHYDYFNEARAMGKDTVGWYIISLDGTRNAVDVAHDIDAEFANSPAETRTSNEAAFAEEYTKQFGDIGLIVMAILGAVFFTILLVAGNTMAQSVRERISELGVLKTLGFTDGTAMGIVMSEGLLISFMGGVLGLVLARVLLPGFAKAMSLFVPGGMVLHARDLAIALAIMTALGLVTGIFPALRARRITIIQALSRH